MSYVLESWRRRRNVGSQFISPTTEALNEPPIVVGGIFRSGTTLLRYLLDSHSRIACPPETAFMGYLPAVLETERCRVGFSSMGFDEDHVIHKMREFVSYFMSNYAASRGKRRWADKSPNCVDSLDFIARMFPEGQFVIIHRHGFDQAHSTTRGGTWVGQELESYCQDDEDPRIGATRYWCEKTATIRDFLARHPDQCIEMHYAKLCGEPERELTRMFEFLGEPWEPAVLQYYEAEHDLGYEDRRVSRTRKIQVSEGHYKEWPSDVLAACREIADPTLEQLGYTV